MTSRQRVVLASVLLAAVATLVIAMILGGPWRMRHEQRTADRTPEVPHDDGAAVPIAAEAQVFRTTTAMLSAGTTRARPAHPRNLSTYRRLRAYPGAPPRLPHGLTAAEYRDGTCNVCHERGGYSVRFNAYVPVTPHPEMTQCLQCHIGDAQLMATPLPSADPSSTCRQCHVPGQPRRSDASLDWRSMPWPTVVRASAGMFPPAIPHDSPMRVNCLTCHASPAGVAEIQTRHPERANCRQCHVQADAAISGTAVDTGGGT